MTILPIAVRIGFQFTLGIILALAIAAAIFLILKKLFKL